MVEPIHSEQGPEPSRPPNMRLFGTGMPTAKCPDCKAVVVPTSGGPADLSGSAVLLHSTGIVLMGGPPHEKVCKKRLRVAGPQDARRLKGLWPRRGS